MRSAIKLRSFRKQKKGIFFLIDAILAMVMLVVGGFVILGTYFIEPSVLQLDALAVSIIEYYGSTPIESIQHPTLTVLRDCDAGSCAITDPSLTFAEQLIAFYYQNTTNSEIWMKDLVKNITVNELPVSADLALVIDGNVVYNTSDISTSARAIIPGKLLVVYVDDNFTLYGPTSLEVLLW